MGGTGKGCGAVQTDNGSLAGKVVLGQRAGRGEAGRLEGVWEKTVPSRENRVGQDLEGDSCLVGLRNGQ